MPTNAKVFISYGPYEAVGIVDYRESRLQGLKGKPLTKHIRRHLTGLRNLIKVISLGKQTMAETRRMENLQICANIY